MSSFRSATGGAAKPRSHNVNSVYSGKNTAASKASGPSKHGLQSLGKATAVVRRMPPPATLPSLKAEHGQDPSIAIVPQGGTGWTKSPDSDANKQNGSTDASGNAPDLRPTWAKPAPGTAPSAEPNSVSSNLASSQGTTAQIVAGQSVPPNNRDFPSLAASFATAPSGKTDTSALKPQKAGAWGANVSEPSVEIPSIPLVGNQQWQSGGYIGASTAPKPHVERKLPERYFSSQPPTIQSRAAAKIGIREKLARLSMESKEPPAEPEPPKPSETPNPAPAVTSPEPSPAPATSVAAAPAAPAAPATTSTSPPQTYQQPQMPVRVSQDVRQLHPASYAQEPPPPMEWQQPHGAANGAFECEPSSGRGDPGYGRPSHHGGYAGVGYPGQQRFDEHGGHAMKSGGQFREAPMEDLGWSGDMHMDARRAMPPHNRGNIPTRYRGDSRSSTEADNGWHGGPMPQAPQQFGQGPRRGPMPPSNAWYDGAGYAMPPPDYHGGMPAGPGNYQQRSRTSSIATDYSQPSMGEGVKSSQRRQHEADYRQSYGNYAGEMHDEPQQQQQQVMRHAPPTRAMPPQQMRVAPPEMPYRMLKRNDEKSAEYIAHHGGGPISQQPPPPMTMDSGAYENGGGAAKPSTGGKPKDAKKTGGRGKPEEQSDAPTAPASTQNVWEKRLEQQRKEKPNARYQAELEYNFPSINETTKEGVEWTPTPPTSAPPPNDAYGSGPNRRSQRRGENVTRDPRFPPRDAQAMPRSRNDSSGEPSELIGSAHWVQSQTGPSWDNLTIPADHRSEVVEEEDDVYTGTKREFVNSKRTRGGGSGGGAGGGGGAPKVAPEFPPRTGAAVAQRVGRGASSNGRSTGPQTNGRKQPAPAPTQPKPPVFDAPKRTGRAEDNFSNMGEFHAEDYKIPEDGSEDTSRRGKRSTASSRSSRNAPAWQGKSGSERPSKNGEEVGECENGEGLERSKTRGAGRRGGAQGASNKSNDRFLSKTSTTTARQKEGANRGLRASADRSNDAVKSPVVSEGVDDEWETASESSDVADREKPIGREVRKAPAGRNGTNGTRRQNGASDANATGGLAPTTGPDAQQSSQQSTSTRAGQKNVKPASHTFQGSGGSGKSSSAYSKNSNNCGSSSSQLGSKPSRSGNPDSAKATSSLKPERNARDGRRVQGSQPSAPTHPLLPSKDGLAGVDINDASVIVIDDRPDLSRDEIVSEAGDFEEVLSKKQKKQRQLQIEEERRKEQREKERVERQQARRTKALQKRTEKSAKKVQEKDSVSPQEVSVNVEEPCLSGCKTDVELEALSAKASPVLNGVEHDLGTTVWNSVHLAPAVVASIVEEVQPTHIPSPIARPTKSQSSAPTSQPSVPPTSVPAASTTVDISAVKNDFATFNDLVVSTVPTHTTAARYDFTFDPKIKPEAPIGSKPGPHKLVETFAAPANECSAVVTSPEDYLKEKLDKVKEYWGGAPSAQFDHGFDNGIAEKSNNPSLSQAHGPNVAKVKPQPQQPEQTPPSNDGAKAAKTMETCSNNVFTMPPAQSPNLYHQGSAIFALQGPNSTFGAFSSTPSYSVLYGGNEYISAYGTLPSSPPAHHSMYNVLSTQQPRAQLFDGIFNSANLWSNGLDFFSNASNAVQPGMGGNGSSMTGGPSSQRYNYSNNSRPSSRPSPNTSNMGSMGAGNVGPPPPNYSQNSRQASGSSFLPTHLPPPPMHQQGSFLSDFVNQPSSPIGSNRGGGGNGARFNGPAPQVPMQNYRSQPVRPPHPHAHHHHHHQQQHHQQQQQQHQFGGGYSNGLIASSQAPPPHMRGGPMVSQSLQQAAPGSTRNVFGARGNGGGGPPPNWQKHHHQQQQQQQQHPSSQGSGAGGPSNYGSYFKYGANQPTV